ncbi:Nuclease precursor [Limihaloglobus sulfuriphilus]|uniref:Nuclease n=1 Tax=Limihaloglobus sulfuriphilus TaxID=1851148 RepID=A0A1Q2MAW7_9BACT|nr:DNA/RNA non-specific endonuclease [Limihaloglobus sulfuriphilus]AQQ69678.1 Nuclease precursor [Limihaloglobus sulfuriphilus]
MNRKISQKLPLDWISVFSLLAAIIILSGCGRSVKPARELPPAAIPVHDYEELCFYGCPAGGYDILLENIGYKAGYSESRKCPLWAAYFLDINRNMEYGKRPSRFKSDTRTNSQLTHNDYTHSGFDRGHMAPNYGIGKTAGREAQLETFYMSNICPQVPAHNQQIWRKLEELTANTYSTRYGRIWVITGPVFDSNTQRLESGVEIPDAFYKILIRPQESEPPRVIAFLIPQDCDIKADLDQYLSSVDDIEKLTGIDFMRRLPDEIEEKIESSAAVNRW